MVVVGIIENGVWKSIEDGRPAVIDTPRSDVERVVAHLAQVVRLAQDLSDDDARRVRDFVHAASAMLSATTYLAKSDQKIFEASLRGGGDAT
jgi:hypothetical protein